MINMIKADCYRTTKHIAFYVAVGLMLLMLGISIYMISPGKMGISAGGTSGDMALAEMPIDDYSNISISDLREFMKSREDYKLDRDIQSVNVNLYYIFIFIAAVVIAVDFTGGCAKNTLTSAISRKKYFISKVVTVTGMCLVLYFANTYIMYFANLIFNGANLSSGLWAVTEVALIQLPVVSVIIIIPVCIAFMAKKTAIYNLVTIPLLIILQLLLGYGSVLFPIPKEVMNYTPDAMFALLANNPGREYLAISYLVCAVVCVVFLAAGYLTFKKTEIR